VTQESQQRDSDEGRTPPRRRVGPRLAVAAAAVLFLALAGAVADMIIATATEVRGGREGTGVVQLGARNFGYVPDSIVVHGNSVTIRFTNDGYSAHTFTVDNEDLDVVVQPGQTRTIRLMAGPSDLVEFYCRFHQNYGMRGTVAFNR
jgi:plastocyanin